MLPVRCQFQTTEEEGLLFCPRCNRSCRSTDPPQRTHRVCRCRSRGLGDTIARFTRGLGLRACGRCRRRQDRLNKLWPYDSPQ